MKENDDPKQNLQDEKQRDLLINRSVGTNKFMTTNQGVKVNDDNNMLKAGDRGPSLLEDFIYREKMTHFDHERIPERIVHARGSGAHGFFECTNPIPEFTKAGFLQEKGMKTPVFARFSTVQGSRGSTDLARDVRGFSVKFYTQEGIYDLVANNMPVFFIQDAMKFPDLVHAVKPEPHHEIPEASSAHDTFWDFISLMPESMHMIMWLMSDRAIPRSYRMMEGFGVHTFRFINENNESHFVKFHWKPKLGTHAVIWDEAQKISGKNSDFHRQDLWEAIDQGHFPEWEFGVQIVPEADEHKYDFDLLDPTKIIPEELVPVQIIGRMVLNKNPDNFFAETEQIAFHPGHVVPGIDFTNDPLLQGRLFSYTDTQLIRLGGPNFHEIPINRTLAPMHNNQRNGYHRHEVNVGRVAYFPNSLANGTPFQTPEKQGGFVSHNERVEAHKVRARSESFADHFSQAKLFLDSQTEVERKHIIKAFRFELGKCETTEIRLRMLGLLAQVDEDLAADVAKGLGMKVPAKPFEKMNHGVPPNEHAAAQEPKPLKKSAVKASKPLSMINHPSNSPTIATRRVAFVCADGVSEDSIVALKTALKKQDACPFIVAQHLGFVTTDQDGELPIDFSYFTASSVMFDAIFVLAGTPDDLGNNADLMDFISDAYRHCKVIGVDALGKKFIESTHFSDKIVDSKELGLLVRGKSVDEAFAQEFIEAMTKHRFWAREDKL
ncbi:MAG: catalase [Flavobacterium sp.]|nr:catalase [Flavobacterium sp.]